MGGCACRIVAWQELASVLTLVALPNCGGSVSSAAPSDDSGIVARDASVEAQGVVLDAGLDRVPADGLTDALGGSCSVPCPVSEPTVGDSCDFVGACEYGGSPFALCNRLYDCTSGHVGTGAPLDASACPLGLFPDCPASRAMIVPGESCGMTNGLQCVYVDGECDCLPGNGTSPTWECSGADASISQGCPVPRAVLGTPCSSAGASCQQLSTRSYEVCLSCGNRWGSRSSPDGNSATPLLSDRDEKRVS